MEVSVTFRLQLVPEDIQEFVSANLQATLEASQGGGTSSSLSQPRILHVGNDRVSLARRHQRRLRFSPFYLDLEAWHRIW